MNLRDFVEASKPATLDHKDGFTQVRCLDAFTLWVDDKDESVTPSLKQYGYWEAWITAWMIENVKPGMDFIDIGAHCGYYTMLGAYLGAFVVAYEPNPRYYNCLYQSSTDNRADTLIKPIALSDFQGHAQLSFPNGLTGSASIVDKFEDNVVEIEVTTLAEELKRKPGQMPDKIYPDIIKIDAEGAEGAIIRGSGLMGAEDAPVLLLEYFPSKDFKNKDLNTYFLYGDVYVLDYEGKEQPFSQSYLDEIGEDWLTLIVRPSRTK